MIIDFREIKSHRMCGGFFVGVFLKLFVVAVALLAHVEELAEFRERPQFIVDDEFEFVGRITDRVEV